MFLEPGRQPETPQETHMNALIHTLVINLLLVFLESHRKLENPLEIHKEIGEDKNSKLSLVTNCRSWSCETAMLTTTPLCFQPGHISLIFINHCILFRVMVDPGKSRCEVGIHSVWDASTSDI